MRDYLAIVLLFLFISNISSRAIGSVKDESDSQESPENITEDDVRKMLLWYRLENAMNKEFDDEDSDSDELSKVDRQNEVSMESRRRKRRSLDDVGNLRNELDDDTDDSNSIDETSRLKQIFDNQARNDESRLESSEEANNIDIDNRPIEDFD